MKRKKKNNKTRIFISILAIFVVLIGIIMQSVDGSSKENNNIVSGAGNEEKSDDWETAFKSDTKQLIYLGRPTCSWCNKIKPGLDNFKEKYNVDFVYINTDETNGSDLDAIFAKLEIDADEFGTPYLVVIENGKKIDEQVGYIPEKELFEFYQKNGLIDADKKYEQ